MHKLTIEDYVVVRPWLRLVIAVIYGVAHSEQSVHAATLFADQHLVEFEMFPGSIDRGEDLKGNKR